MQNGFNDFLPKPIDIRQLNSILNSYVRDNQPIEVIRAARQNRQNGNGYARQAVTDKLKGKEVAGMDVERGVLR
jgi:DNA-binding response OmpR family regulator